MSRNQQNNLINCNFRQGSCKLITLEPKAYLRYHSAVFLQNLCGSKGETLLASQKIQLGTGVRKVWRELCGPLFYHERKAGQDKMLILTLMLYCISKSYKIQVAKVATKQIFKSPRRKSKPHWRDRNCRSFSSPVKKFVRHFVKRSLM